MNIGVDIMGGDFAPEKPLEGVKLAARELSESDKLFLFGKAGQISEYLSGANIPINKIEIIDCDENIEMGDDPVRAFLEKEFCNIQRFCLSKAK